MKLGVQSTLLGSSLLIAITGFYLTENHDPENGKPEREENARVQSVRLPATLMPSQIQHVYPQVGGQVREMLVDEGAHVRVGQVLARLDRTDYELKYRIALATVDRARAHLAEQEAKIKRHAAAIQQADAEIKEATALRVLAAKKANRMEELQRKGSVDEKLVSESETQSQAAQAHEQQVISKRNVLQLEPEKEALAVAKAELSCAEIERESAKFRLDKTEIRSPADGTVLKKEVDLFTNVGPGWGSGRASSIYRMGDLSQMEAVAEVPEQLITKIHLGLKCMIQVDSVPNGPFEGEMARIKPVVSSETRTVTVFVKVKTEKHLVPGCYAQVEIPLKE